MTAPMQDDNLMLQAYCDGELDAAAMVVFERRMAADADLRRRHDQLMMVRQHLRALPVSDLPPMLESKIKAAVATPRVSRRWTWQALAASVFVGIVVGSGGTLRYQRGQYSQEVAGQVVSNHIRSVLAQQPFDVASSDRHTVKPWFTTRLPESPLVPDLSAAGFALAGGRVDVIGQNPVATVVYRRAAHVISLTALAGDRTVTEATTAGYRTISWNDGGTTYIAVSDLPAADLVAFQRAFIAESRKL
jgi:anti-sigma factor RsiW